MTDFGAEQRIVVIGGGQAGLTALAKLRALSMKNPITLVCKEPQYPYQRPPLSKGYVLGDVSRERLFLRPESFYEDQFIDVRLNQSIESIDRAAKQVRLSNGEVLGYCKLILTTGATPIRLPDAMGGNLGGVFYMRDLADADAIAQAMTTGKKVLVVGGGYIGLEGAAVARKLGLEVTLVEAGERILNRVASAETADYFRDLHQQNGVNILEGVSLSELRGQNDVIQEAVLSDGTTVACDIVLVGIGVRPNQQLAEAAGLALDNGIRVDERCITSDPDIFAAGDCASFPWHDGRLRLESVGNAIDQAEAAAAQIAGQGTGYVAKPWFWSDQYDVKLQIAGLSTGYSSIVTRRTDHRVVSFWYYDQDTLLAVDALNDPRSYMIAKRLIEAGQSPDKAQVADLAVDLKTLLGT